MPDFQIPGADGAEPTTITVPDGYAVVGEGLDAPDGYVPSDRFTAEVDRRVNAAVKNRGYLTPEDAYTDEAVRRELVKRGYDLDAEGQPVAKLSPEKTEEIRKALRTEEVEPLRQQLTETQERYQAAQKAQRAADLRQQLAPTLADAAFAAAIPGTPSPFDAMLSLVQEDDQGKAYFQAGADGIPDYDVAGAIAKHVTKLAPSLLRDKRQQGAPAPGAGGDSGTGYDAAAAGKAMAAATSGPDTNLALS